MQRQKKRKCEHAIGFKIFKCEQTVKSLDEQYFRYNSSVGKNTSMIRFFTVTSNRDIHIQNELTKMKRNLCL